MARNFYFYTPLPAHLISTQPAHTSLGTSGDKIRTSNLQPWWFLLSYVQLISKTEAVLSAKGKNKNWRGFPFSTFLYLPIQTSWPNSITGITALFSLTIFESLARFLFPSRYCHKAVLSVPLDLLRHVSHNKLVINRFLSQHFKFFSTNCQNVECISVVTIYLVY